MSDEVVPKPGMPNPAPRVDVPQSAPPGVSEAAWRESSAQDDVAAGPDDALTRRSFLQSSALAAASLTVLGTEVGCGSTPEPSPSPDPTAGPEDTPTGTPSSLLPKPVTEFELVLWVNGQELTVELEARETLAEVLRNRLGLMGTHIGCDRGACGACTVLLDGRPVVSCSMLAVEALGHELTTIEGLATASGLHPLQEAFVAHDALQCGFCTSGMLMSSKALLDSHPAPDETTIRSALSGNLCRCGTYPRIFSAIQAVAS